jgi:hypothetical protein
MNHCPRTFDREAFKNNVNDELILLGLTMKEAIQIISTSTTMLLYHERHFTPKQSASKLYQPEKINELNIEPGLLSPLFAQKFVS